MTDKAQEWTLEVETNGKRRVKVRIVGTRIALMVAALVAIQQGLNVV